MLKMRLQEQILEIVKEGETNQSIDVVEVMERLQNVVDEHKASDSGEENSNPTVKPLGTIQLNFFLLLLLQFHFFSSMDRR